ncbi:MAG: hypothetical protein NTY89_21340 [Nostocales cyanobacterium LacPavin_0920_SED1_MAG_38_18]|jgi:hypothetical protein|uniref:hypothetical protein n=1 Tax=Anabaena sp. WA102 TaxID=1647413 RepID=UPI0019021C62|nr:hypothetical protein [Anabaena sp. WA102]MCX5984281.1 hypothetical protein [Nostocales cyanobacterium LacPavin_0920_SED1_MAG_38_18]
MMEIFRGCFKSFGRLEVALQESPWYQHIFREGENRGFYGLKNYTDFGYLSK